MRGVWMCAGAGLRCACVRTCVRVRACARVCMRARARFWRSVNERERDVNEREGAFDLRGEGWGR